MLQADQFVLADDVQYTTHSFINRVQIKTARGAQWLTVPVLTRGRGVQIIKDVQIDSAQNWQRKQWRTLYHNYKLAPYFEHYADFFQTIYQQKWNYLIDLNISIIEFLKEMLHIPTPLELSSPLHLSSNASLRLAEMVSQLNGTVYLSGPGGKKYLERSHFEQRGISIQYISFSHPKYRQQFGEFIPNLSVIDLLFNEGPLAATILNNVPIELESG
ncbi:MAG: WbqC family protein [Calditrichia bacterium]